MSAKRIENEHESTTVGIFGKLLTTELERRKISIRIAAAEIGISHATLIAARDGRRTIDTETGIKIANWIGVPFSTIISRTNPSEVENDNVLQAFQMVLRAAPELETVFKEAANELVKGTLSFEDFSEIAEFAAYKINKRREQAAKNVSGKQ